jgi:hypothetical protein
LLWYLPRRTQSAKAECVVTLGEALAVIIGHQGTVIVERLRQAESAKKKHLSSGGAKKVRSPNDLRYVHRGVVDDNGELVGRHVISTPDHEITEVAAGDKFLGTELQVVESDALTIGNAEAPVQSGGIVCIARFLAAAAGIDGLVVRGLGQSGSILVRSLGGLREVFARTRARVDGSAAHKIAPCFEVESASLALLVRGKGAADVGAFVPLETEPAKIFVHRALKLGAGTIWIQVFVAKNKHAAGGAGTLVGCPEGAGVPEMEVSSR